MCRTDTEAAETDPQQVIPPQPTSRLGFMIGEMQVPDDFDTMFQDEIIAMFEGRD